MVYKFFITKEKECEGKKGCKVVYATIKGLGLDERDVYLEDIVNQNDPRAISDVVIVSYTDGEYNVVYTCYE